MPSPRRQHLPEDLAHCAPGPRLGSLLAGIDPTRLTGPDCVAVLQAWHRQVAYTQAQFMEAVVEVGLCRPAPEGVVSRDIQPCWQGADEIRAALALTRGAADRQLGLAWDLRSRLPQVHQALTQGRIDQPRARVFSEWTTDLETPQAERICAMLLPKAGALTTGQLIDQIKRMIIAIDPEWAARRYTRAVGERRVVGHLTPDGTANLSGLDLPADQAASAAANIEALARRVKRAGDHRPIDHIRADLYLGLLDGSFTGCDERQIITHLLGQVRQSARPGPADPKPADSPPANTRTADPIPANTKTADPRPVASKPDEPQPDKTRAGEPPYDRTRERTSGQTRPGTEHRGSTSADTRETTNRPDPAHFPEPSSSGHTEPADATEPAASSGPTEPTAASDPADPTEPTGRSGPQRASDAAPSAAANDPASPASPPSTAEPAATSGPAEPTVAPGPTDPAEPAARSGRPLSAELTEDPGHGGGMPRSRTGPGTGPRAGVELRVELSTLLGLDRHPAELAGWGYIHAEAARSIAAGQTGAQWRYTVCDDHGVLLHDGLITTRPTGFPPRSPRPGAIIEIRIPLTLLQRLFTEPDQHPPWAKIIAGIVRDIHDASTADAQASDGEASDGEADSRSSTLGMRSSRPVTGSDSGPPGGSVPYGERRFPDARTRRHVQVRDQRCQFPGCRMPARDTDTDHIRQWISGGPSLDHNLVSLCRHDHRIKDEGGWRLSRVSDSLLHWTSRLGLTYTIRRPSVIIPLPDPLPGRRSARAVATDPFPLASATAQHTDPAPAPEPEGTDTGGPRREHQATPPEEFPIWLRSARSGGHSGDETRPDQRATLIHTEEDDVPF